MTVDFETLLLVAAAALAGYLLGRRHAGARAMRSSVFAARRSEPAALDPALRVEIERLLATGETIAAIRLCRQRTGLGLKEAKNLVDGLAPHARGHAAKAP